MAYERSRPKDALVTVAIPLAASICSGLTFVLGNLILRPVIALTGVSRRLAALDLDIETVSAGCRDEIGARAEGPVFSRRRWSTRKSSLRRGKSALNSNHCARSGGKLARQFDQDVAGELTTEVKSLPI